MGCYMVSQRNRSKSSNQLYHASSWASYKRLVPPIASSWAYNARTLDCPSHSLLLGLQCKDPRIASSWASYKDPRASYKHPQYPNQISKSNNPRRLDIFHLYERSIF